MKHILLTFLIFNITLQLWAVGNPTDTKHFYTLNERNGLSSNRVLQLMQLADGRLVVATQRGIDIYDRTDFAFIPIGDKDRYELSGYEGQTHLYADAGERLWVKTYKQVCCIDLRTYRTIPDPTSKVVGADAGKHVDDLFVDGEKEVWVVRDTMLENPKRKVSLRLPVTQEGELQDLMTRKQLLYLFFANGGVRVYDRIRGNYLYQLRPYPKEQASRWNATSLVCQDSDGRMYQIRTGRAGSVFTILNPHEKTFSTRFSCSYILHTLALSASHQAIISSPEGYLVFPTTNAQTPPQHIARLQLPDGTILTPGVNTIYCDRQGGLWLGTYKKGLLYASPYLGLFDARPKGIDLCPILTRVFVNGEPIQQGQIYNQRVLQPFTAAATDSLMFTNDEDNVAFQFSTMNYVDPRSTIYRYRLNGGSWTLATADSLDAQVDGNGILYMTFGNLSPGDYTLEVMASTHNKRWNGKVRKLYFHMAPSPWMSPAAWMAYVAVLLIIVAAAWKARLHYLKQRADTRTLMAYIEELSDKCRSLEQKSIVGASIPESADAGEENTRLIIGAGVETETTATDTTGSLTGWTDEMRDFLNQAISHVEKHLDDTHYGVEQLATDMCMERTGLYKKMKSITGTSPVNFIRSLRLQRAREMMNDGDTSLTDIVYAAGFSSASYFTKCFKTEFGVKPSEYIQTVAERKKKG